jgi:hypothetical protein
MLACQLCKRISGNRTITKCLHTFCRCLFTIGAVHTTVDLRYLFGEDVTSFVTGSDYGYLIDKVLFPGLSRG